MACVADGLPFTLVEPIYLFLLHARSARDLAVPENAAVHLSRLLKSTIGSKGGAGKHEACH